MNIIGESIESMLAERDTLAKRLAESEHSLGVYHGFLDALHRQLDTENLRANESERLWMEAEAAAAAWRSAWGNVRDSVLNGRHQLAESNMDNDQTNNVLGVLDDNQPATDAGKALLAKVEAAKLMRHALSFTVNNSGFRAAREAAIDAWDEVNGDERSTQPAGL